MENAFVKYRKWWIMLGIVLLVVFCLFFFRVSEVTVEGNSYYSESQMAEMFQDNVLERNVLSFWLLDKLSLTPELPFVTEYEITFPSVNTVHVRLYEKTVVAGISYMNQYIYFDNEGMVLKSTDEPEKKIPLFETKNLTTFTLYSKVKMEDETLLEQILNLANLFQHYEVDWDTVTFNEDNEAYLYAGDITVKLGKRDNYDEQISALASILEQAKKKKLKGTMDLTGYDVKGNVIFTEEK
jgi:cell division protein FtsQ